ncbi:MAG: hypothetical protein CM1200mP30_13570 [Pseudomonadota bacterium]|nr:MAG: hypothetical protein CM1200mP30_13570 [Pseudomonadota bacterium]
MKAGFPQLRHMPGHGHCQHNGMISETLGFTLPGTAAIPAVHADRLRASEATGEQAVKLANAGLTPEQLLPMNP